MKMSIWRRIHAAQAGLILLLVVGMGLALWMEKTRAEAERRSNELMRGGDRIRINLLQMSASLRGLLLDPTNKAEEHHREDSEAEVGHIIEPMLTTYRTETGVSVALRNIKDFVARDMSGFHKSVLQALQRDPAEAIQLHRTKYAELQQRRDDLLRELNLQIDRFAKDEALQAQNVAVGSLIGIGLVLAASLIVGRIQAAAVAVPLQRLIATLERMRVGDFTQRVAADGKDEFAVVGEGLNRLADDLSGLVGQVQRSGILVNTSATEIASTAREQQSTANEIAATTAEIGATSKQISATSKELVKTMNEVSDVSQETAGLANSGQTSIGRMETNMRHILDASGAISAKLAVLNEKTANINTVVTTITKVADQTNLLSLNAAIEAEKAGEYGLGFAVVAMEIRRLADQTAVATYDIEKMVKEMQSAVAAGVMGMEKFSDEVGRGVEDIRQVSTQLAQIIHQVQTLTPRFQTVNEGMHAQATGAQQISETLVQLSESAHQTADSLRLSNVAIEQLNEAARGLQTSVARFRLESK
jgi:methyl-accepting chemotaxis protein